MPTLPDLPKLPERLILRGREFDQKDLKVILECIEAYWEEGRTKISEEICKELRWNQVNGWLKDRACRDVLRRLELMHLIELPPSRSTASSLPYSKWKPAIDEAIDLNFKAVTKIETPLNLRLAKGNDLERTWNNLVQRHHYLGHKVTVGRTLKFIIMGGSQCVAAASLSEPAWSVKERDKALSALGLTKSTVANNSRFLILPSVCVKNLASRILSLVASEGPLMWEKYYGTRLTCLETFVDTSRFKGTSYMAANWIAVGNTQGYRKSGSFHSNSQTPKQVLLYPLSHERRMKLLEYISSQQEDRLKP